MKTKIFLGHISPRIREIIIKRNQKPEPLYFYGLDPETKIRFVIPSDAYTDGILPESSFSDRFETSEDKKTWTDYEPNSWIQIPESRKIWFRTKTKRSLSSGFRFQASGSLKIGGSVMSLLNPGSEVEEISDSAFSALFLDCTSLKDASDLKLPALEIGKSAYQSMFSGCSNLEFGPEEISAEEIPESGCQSMFYDCTSLKKTPKMRATSIGISGCQTMFYNCTSLESIEGTLTAQTLNDYAWYRMFLGCSASLLEQEDLQISSLSKYSLNQIAFNELGSYSTLTLKLPKMNSTDMMTALKSPNFAFGNAKYAGKMWQATFICSDMKVIATLSTTSVLSVKTQAL